MNTLQIAIQIDFVLAASLALSVTVIFGIVVWLDNIGKQEQTRVPVCRSMMRCFVSVFVSSGTCFVVFDIAKFLILSLKGW